MPNSRKFIFYVVAIIAIMISACNMPAGALPAGGESLDLAATITAQALLLQSTASTPTAEGQPASGSENQSGSGTLSDANAQPTATSTTQAVESGSGVLPAATATSNATTVTVSVETNCRKGPSTSYTSVYSLPVGTIANVVGKNTSSGYWIISIPGNANSTCWLWGKYATVSGNTSGLAEVAAPVQNTATATKPPTATQPPPTASNTPTPVSAAPSAPSNVQTTKSCVDNGNGTTTFSGVLTWKDNSNNEMGFFILYPGNAIPLPPNQTSYALNFTAENGVVANMTLTVQASGIPNSAPVNITVSCP